MLQSNSVTWHRQELPTKRIKPYQSCEHSLWSSGPRPLVVSGVSPCWRSSFLFHLQSEGGWEPKLQTNYCYPFYFLHSWDSARKMRKSENSFWQIQLNYFKIILGRCNTLERRCEESEKSGAECKHFCLVTRRTAARWQRFCPPQWGAAGPWERHPAAP